ncbi:hypothetical protein [Psychroflexus sp. ALD_RP9]|uniref:hypothetical protein n=1 Tax=Psychroflexus sp. ALD_RP9 TaxID=2777186 RepID=UPI001A8CDC2A|nr:hypothetical protein [Psychroflexus sp. ALD_RP9]QSS97782.1 hypothetical protein IMZ30_03460 [Psychroflexus sp. ALD_RP9]
MRKFASIISVICHPIFIPTLAVALFFYLFPDFYQKPIVYAKILATAILTIFIPIVFLFIMKSIKLISSFKLPTYNERKLPLLFFLMIDLIVINYIFDIYNYKHLFYFFWALLFSGIICFLGLLFKFKISLHTLGLSSLSFFMIYLSHNFELRLSFYISALLLGTGIVSSMRLYLKAHTFAEVLIGVLLGLATQLIIPLFYIYKM